MLVGKHSGLGLSQAGINTCASNWYWFNPACWDYSHSTYQQMSQFQQPPVPTHDLNASQAATQEFFGNQPYVYDTGDGLEPECTSTIINTTLLSICDKWIYLGGALLVAPLAITLLSGGPRRYGR
jgi:hypothetical protein